MAGLQRAGELPNGQRDGPLEPALTSLRERLIEINTFIRDASTHPAGNWKVFDLGGIDDVLEADDRIKRLAYIIVDWDRLRDLSHPDDVLHVRIEGYVRSGPRFMYVFYQRRLSADWTVDGFGHLKVRLFIAGHSNERSKSVNCRDLLAEQFVVNNTEKLHVRGRFEWLTEAFEKR